jgi:hypothetical protein
MTIMDTRRHNIPNILAVGIVVSVLMLTVLFWARSLCGTVRRNRLFQAVPAVKVVLPPSLARKSENDPNRIVHHVVVARSSTNAALAAGLGVAQYMESRLPMGPASYVYNWERGPDKEECFYYDLALGQIVYHGTKQRTGPDGKQILVPFTCYAGPEGVALSTPEEKLGRFVDPVVDRLALRPSLVYDRGSARFFAIDWAGQKVRKGPELPEDGPHHPIQIGLIEKNSESLRVMETPMVYRQRPDHTLESDIPSRQADRFTADLILGPMFMTHQTLVLDASGCIDLLDIDTLGIVRGKMRLPAPAGLYPQSGMVAAKDVAAYSASPISVRSSGAGGPWTYAGCAVAALARDATAVKLEVFDPNGRIIASGETIVPQYGETDIGVIPRRTSTSSPEAAYFRLPGAYGLTLAQFALESLHPPVLQFLTYFAAPHFEATAGYRSLFLLPDSFLAMKARATEDRPIEGFCASMAFMIPALILVLLLAWRVDRDGSRLGLSKKTRTAWVAGTVIFGLPAYLTYYLTRPKATLVTCANCGVGRRPDQEKCHHCGSPWVVPELTPPAWRVLGAPEQAEENSFSREPQADSQVQ